MQTVTCCVWPCCCTEAVVDISAAGSRVVAQYPLRVMALSPRLDLVGSPRGVMLLLPGLRRMYRTLHGSAVSGLAVPASSHSAVTAGDKS